MSLTDFGKIEVYKNCYFKVNDYTKSESEFTIFKFNAIDGFLYVSYYLTRDFRDPKDVRHFSMTVMNSKGEDEKKFNIDVVDGILSDFDFDWSLSNEAATVTYKYKIV